MKESKGYTGWKRFWAALTALTMAAGMTACGGTEVNATKAESKANEIKAGFLVAEPEYPEAAPFPTEEMFTDEKGEMDYEAYDQAYSVWLESANGRREEIAGTGTLTPFFRDSIRQFVAGSDENKAYSPLNVYMALAMLAELTDGESRAQILDTLGLSDIETLRAQAGGLWRAHYSNDGATETVLASSLWLNEDVSFKEAVLKTLAEQYYASSYSGEMGSAEFDKLLQDWLNAQTGGLLSEQVSELGFDPETVLALATTIYYRAKWADGFYSGNNTTDIFHGAAGDVTVEYMNSSNTGAYYWGDKYGAVGLPLGNCGDVMWLLLPDEGVTVDELLADDEAMEFILGGVRENRKDVVIKLLMPKFDVTSETDLCGGLKKLGITDVFDGNESDFSPMTDEVKGIFVSQAEHDVRVAVDEEGVVAVAYTVMAMCGTAMPPEEKVEFRLDRPFVYAITSGAAGMPLFVGAVNQPAAVQ